ncbi:DUF123 domain-containing protein [Alkalihalobacterium chitinilyticum]
MITSCGLLHSLKNRYDGSFPVRGFGSSDCKCSSHLFYVPLVCDMKNV